MKILLVEPQSRTSFPPLGLMKISRYHKLKGDEIHYVVGKNKAAAYNFWDKIYVTSVFTYDYKQLKETIQYYSNNLFNFDNLIVGGVSATLLADKVIEETGAKVHKGLLNAEDDFLIELAQKDSDYRYLKQSGCSIDNLPPDYSLVLDVKKYEKIIGNSFLMYSTKGCPNKCGFCAVRTLEPDYINYIPIKDRVKIMRDDFGDRAGLVFLDNNIAASDKFFDIIDEIIDCGYGEGQPMEYVKNGRKIKKQRFVDFNQGVDLRLLDKKKMNAFSRIAINPLRLAFDHVELAEQYIEKAELAIECKVKKLSNYMLYNYKDKPEDLYRRMSINTDIIKKSDDEDVKIFSFPMRYSPIGQTDRKYIGKHWTKRKVRAIQLILQATHGIVSHSLSQYKDGEGYFYRAFGANEDDFRATIMMPFNYIINRDKYEYELDNIAEWKRAYANLSNSERNELAGLVGDGLDSNLTKTKSGKLMKLLEHYEGEHTQVEK